MDIKEIFEFNKPYNEKILNELIEKIKTNKIVPYIGAGMSFLESGIYPTWGQFLSETVIEYELDIDEFKNIKDFEEKATYLYSELGSKSFPKHLGDVFNAEKLNGNIDWSKKAVQIIPNIFNSGLLVTTNYDSVLEKVYLNNGKILKVAHPKHTEALNKAIFSDDLLLYKIHGDISEPETSIILTKEQYDLAYNDDNFKKVIKHIFDTKELLFIGCSLQKDRPLEIMKECLVEGKNSFAIIPCENDKVNKRDKRVTLEAEFGIQSVIYPNQDHECVKIILEYIYQNTRQLDNNLFNKQKIELTREWFSKQNNYAIKNLGERYSPEVSVGLKISEIFNGLGRNKIFITKIRSKFENILKFYKSIQYYTKEYDQIVKSYFDSTLSYIIEYNLESLEIFDIKKLNELSTEFISTIISIIDDINKKQSKEQINKQSEQIGNLIYKFEELIYLVEQFIELINSDEVAVINNPFVLVQGVGGIGKSHLLADTVFKRTEDDQKSIFLLGQHFINESNPLLEITKFLNLQCDIDQFFNELNKIGQNDRKRVIIFIDALNEGNGKKIWANHLQGLVDKLQKYEWLGLVISIRSEYIEQLFFENKTLQEKFINIKHHGLSELKYDAIKKYFAYYRIPFLDTPLSNEFNNPLFLRLFCKTYEKKNVDFSNITLLDIFNDYIKHTNMQISNAIAIDFRINVVEKALNQIVIQKYNNKGINLVGLDTVVEIIADIECKYNLPNKLLSELISCGILTQSIVGEIEYIYITYEKVEDYLYSIILVSKLDKVGIEVFSSEYSDLINSQDILEMFAIVLSETKNIEIFEVFKDIADYYYIIEKAFLNTIKWRSTNSITVKTIEYMNHNILKKPNLFELLLEICIIVSPKTNFPFNAEVTCNLIKDRKMSDRDALYIPMFDIIYERRASLKSLLDWCFEDNEKMSVDTLKLTGIMLSACLITSNNTIRNKTTRALIHLLKNNAEVVIDILEFYNDIDDPYLIERLYAIAFGVITFEEDIDKIKKIALYTYDNIFKSGIVNENILVRDFAKNIVEYAKTKTDDENIKNLNVKPPYNSKMPNIPTDKAIEAIDFEYRISSSMRVNDGLGGYGDFGRYTFQNYFSDWKYILRPNDLMKIALCKIKSYGYDNDKHLNFDKTLSFGRTGDNRKERIGKKYQWLALYELASQVADSFKIKTSEFSENNTYEWCKGSFKPNLRQKIDPTLIITNKDNVKLKELHNKLYTIPDIVNRDWLKNYNDVPNADSILTCNNKNEEFLLLHGWYKWEEENNFSNTSKDLFIFVNSYIVKSNDYEKAKKLFESKKYDSRCLVESINNHVLYNREYYWSDAYEYFEDNEYEGDWQLIDYYSDSELKAIIPTKTYYSERQGEEESLSGEFYKPCRILFEELKMEYRADNFTMYNQNNDIVCFDSRELLNEEIGFFINKQKLFEFLKKNDYKIIWRFISEKTVNITKGTHWDTDYERLNMSEIILIDDKDTFVSNRIVFEDKSIYEK